MNFYLHVDHFYVLGPHARYTAFVYGDKFFVRVLTFFVVEKNTKKVSHI